MKCKKCNKQLIPYQENTYPFEHAYNCPICYRSWSDLQIVRAGWNCSEKEKEPYGADGLILKEKK